MSEEKNLLRIRLVRKEEQIILEDENGQEKEYTIKEMVGTEFGKWRTAMATRLKVSPDGKPLGVRDFKGMEASLISKCLYDETGQPVPERVIEAWPTAAQQELFRKCQEINGMDKDEEDDKKGKD